MFSNVLAVLQDKSLLYQKEHGGQDTLLQCFQEGNVGPGVDPQEEYLQDSSPISPFSEEEVMQLTASKYAT